MKVIECELGFGTSNIKYVKPGTIGFVKCINGDIRMCKCIRIDFDDNGKAKYTWDVAGAGLQNGTFYSLDFGIIYKDDDSAQYGSATSSNQKGMMSLNSKFSLHETLYNKYYLNCRDLIKMSGTWNNFLSLQGIAIKKDGTLPYVPLDFEISIDNDGVNVSVPAFDNKTAFPNLNAAKSAYKPKKVITFDNVEVKEEPKVKVVKVTIEVDECKLSEVKALGAIILR